MIGALGGPSALALAQREPYPLPPVLPRVLDVGSPAETGTHSSLSWSSQSRGTKALPGARSCKEEYSGPWEAEDRDPPRPPASSGEGTGRVSGRRGQCCITARRPCLSHPGGQRGQHTHRGLGEPAGRGGRRPPWDPGVTREVALSSKAGPPAPLCLGAWRAVTFCSRTRQPARAPGRARDALESTRLPNSRGGLAFCRTAVSVTHRHLPAVRLWASDLTFLSLSGLTCENGANGRLTCVKWARPPSVFATPLALGPCGSVSRRRSPRTGPHVS